MHQLPIKRYLLESGTRLKSGLHYELKVTPEKVLCTRMTGLLFETDKTFLLPGAIPNIRACVETFKKYSGGQILIVGHADAVGKNKYNRDLSVQRACMVEAYLRDDAHTWLNNYKPSDIGDVWGTREDQMMLQSLGQNGYSFYPGIIDGKKRPEFKEAIIKFQESKQITPNGVLDDDSRLVLIKEYMDEDETTISKATVTMVHGCGEEHPIIKTADEQENAKNRRVELLFFQHAIDPEPKQCTIPGGCEEYEHWINQVTETIDLSNEAADIIEDFTIKHRKLSRPRREEHVITMKNGQRSAMVTFLHLPDKK